MLADEQKARIRSLLAQKYPAETIARELHVPENAVRGVLSGITRRGLRAKGGSPNTPARAVQQFEPSEPLQASYRQSQIQTRDQPPWPAQTVQAPPTATDPYQEARAGVIRKVFSNQNLFWYDWFRTRYAYEGDYANFVEDVVDDFFARRGWRLGIQRVVRSS